MKIEDVLKPPFKTPFDDMVFFIDPKEKGGAVRDKLLDFENELGRVTEMATIAAYRADTSKSRWQFAMSLAFEAVEKEFEGVRQSAARKEALARSKEVQIPGDSEKTTPYTEERKYLAYKYVADRGKDKVREVNTVLDLGRSVLSWDREEISRLNG